MPEKFTPMGELPAPKPQKRGRGQPSLYQPEYCHAIMEASEIAEAGATDVAIAEYLGVTRETIIRWRDAHPEFAEACAAIKQNADDRMEASLFHRGMGYSHSAVKIFMPAGAAAPVYADYTEHYPPDTAAASLWLRNRRPDKWRDRVEHTGKDGADLIPAALPALEQAKILAHALEIAARKLVQPGDGAKVIEGEAKEPTA
jgi:hypothetical protein